MGSYFTDRFDALISLFSAIAESPGFFAIVFVIFGPLIWWKWRTVAKSGEKVTSDMTHGLRAEADAKTARHDTGIGTKDIFVMRPDTVGGMVWFCLIFFGGGAVFCLMVVLPSDPSSENWWNFAGMMGFTIGSMGVIEISQTRIVVDDVSLERRRVLHRRERIFFNEIASVSLNAKAASPLLKIETIDGRILKISARYSGFLELLDRLNPFNPSLSIAARIIRRTV